MAGEGTTEEGDEAAAMREEAAQGVGDMEAEVAVLLVLIVDGTVI